MRRHLENRRGMRISWDFRKSLNPFELHSKQWKLCSFPVYLIRALFATNPLFILPPLLPSCLDTCRNLLVPYLQTIFISKISVWHFLTSSIFETSNLFFTIRSGHISRLAHPTPILRILNFNFPNLKCCKVFLLYSNIKSYIGIFGCIVIWI